MNRGINRQNYGTLGSLMKEHAGTEWNMSDKRTSDPHGPTHSTTYTKPGAMVTVTHRTGDNSVSVDHQSEAGSSNTSHSSPKAAQDNQLDSMGIKHNFSSPSTDQY